MDPVAFQFTRQPLLKALINRSFPNKRTISTNGASWHDGGPVYLKNGNVVQSLDDKSDLTK